MSKKQTTATDYKSRLLKTPEQAQNEQIDSNVEQASIALKMGLLTMESKISAANGEVLQKQTNVTNAQKQLDEAKGSTSNSLVQNLIDAYQNVKQQEANLEAAQKDLQDLKDLQSFLVETQKELF